MATKLRTLAHHIATEARLQGLEPGEYYSRFRQSMQDDDEQARYDLYNDSLEVLQKEAELELEYYFEENIEIDNDTPPDLTSQMANARPPFPVEISKVDLVYSHSGFARTRQELRAWVHCDDNIERYVIWDCEFSNDDRDNFEDTSIDWWNKDVTERVF
jgi:hypothetical protein